MEEILSPLVLLMGKVIAQLNRIRVVQGLKVSALLLERVLAASLKVLLLVLSEV